jgi:hypothetical protein
MTFEMWLVMQLVDILKAAFTVGLCGLALVPAMRMAFRGRRK